MKLTATEWLAGVLVALEGAGILLLAGWQGVELVGGNTEYLATAIALLVLTLIVAAAVIAFGVSAMRGLSWGRSGGIVTQLLILAVAGGAATGAYAHPMLGAAIGMPALIVLVLLFIAVGRAGRRARAAEATD